MKPIKLTLGMCPLCKPIIEYMINIKLNPQDIVDIITLVHQTHDNKNKKIEV